MSHESHLFIPYFIFLSCSLFYIPYFPGENNMSVC